MRDACVCIDICVCTSNKEGEERERENVRQRLTEKSQEIIMPPHLLAHLIRI